MDTTSYEKACLDVLLNQNTIRKFHLTRIYVTETINKAIKELKQKDMSIISCLKKLSEFSDRILKFLAQKLSYIQDITNFLNKIKGHSM